MKTTSMLLALLLTTVSLSSQTVPVPSQMLTAQTVFVSNAGAPDDQRGFAIYSALYRQMVAYKRFQLEARPADAELSFAVSLSSPELSVTGSEIRAPVLRLDVRDIKTGIVLWSFGASVSSRTLEKDLTAAVAQVVMDFDSLVRGTFAPTLSGQKTRFQQDQPK